MYADLHSHSHYSDGTHAPAELLQRACSKGLTHLAITDHDCMQAFYELTPVAEIELVAGVEVSCVWEDREIHVLGLCIDPHHTRLTSLLEQQQLRRKQRLLAIAEKLARLGCPGLGAYLEDLPAQAWTRSHAAAFLAESGAVKSPQKAFKQFLGRRGKAYVPMEWCSMGEAISTINDSGGIATLAHPCRYSLSRRKLQGLLADFRQNEGAAVEASYGNIDPRERQLLQELAAEAGLLLSQGSDFHTASAHWTDLGKFPRLGVEGEKNAIWHHPRWHCWG